MITLASWIIDLCNLGQLSIEGVTRVLEGLREQNRIEWIDKTRKRCLVYWRTPEEWGDLIYRYISESGLTNTVCTLFELTSGDDTKNQGIFYIGNHSLLFSSFFHELVVLCFRVFWVGPGCVDQGVESPGSAKESRADNVWWQRGC